MAEKSKIKKDCFHYWRKACTTLECLVCEERDCSFYETEEEYIKRQKEFREKYKPIELKNAPKY